MIHAYVIGKAADRANVTGFRRHAVDDIARITGTLDTECGVTVVRDVGPWEPGHPNNCPKCVRLLAEQEVNV